MNPDIFDSFMSFVEGGTVLEIGLRHSALDYLRTKFNVKSYDIGTSRFRYDMNSIIKQNMFVKFPFDAASFGGVVCNKVLQSVGDSVYFIKELVRVSDGPILIYDVSVDAFPMRFFEDTFDIRIIELSVDGRVLDINQCVADFATRPDLRRLFYRPGGSLSKFSKLVPEDIKTECGMLIQKIR